MTALWSQILFTHMNVDHQSNKLCRMYQHVCLELDEIRASYVVFWFSDENNIKEPSKIVFNSDLFSEFRILINSVYLSHFARAPQGKLQTRADIVIPTLHPAVGLPSLLLAYLGVSITCYLNSPNSHLTRLLSKMSSTKTNCKVIPLLKIFQDFRLFPVESLLGFQDCSPTPCCDVKTLHYLVSV